MPRGKYPRTQQHRNRIREATKATQFKKGLVPWNKGIKWTRGPNKKLRSKEWCRKLSKAKKGQPSWNKGVYGEQSHTWKGGKSSLTERIRISAQYKEWRAKVFRRDGWTCQTCGLRGHGYDIEAHHIIPMRTILKKVAIKGLSVDDRYLLAMTLKELFDVDNGITLTAKFFSSLFQLFLRTT